MANLPARRRPDELLCATRWPSGRQRVRPRLAKWLLPGPFRSTGRPDVPRRSVTAHPLTSTQRADLGGRRRYSGPGSMGACLARAESRRMLIRDCAAGDIETLERHMPTWDGQVHANLF